jgi:hypothetical protein
MTMMLNQGQMQTEKRINKRTMWMESNHNSDINQYSGCSFITRDLKASTEKRKFPA